MHSNIKLCIETSNVDQITIFLDGILAMENYKNTHYLFCLYMKFLCRYVFIFVKHFSWEISALCPKFLHKTAVTCHNSQCNRVLVGLHSVSVCCFGGVCNSQFCSQKLNEPYLLKKVILRAEI